MAYASMMNSLCSFDVMNLYEVYSSCNDKGKQFVNLLELTFKCTWSANKFTLDFYFNDKCLFASHSFISNGLKI